MNQSAELAIVDANLVRARGERFYRHKNLLRIYPPFWCEEGSDDYTFFEEYQFLLEKGHIVWGAIVQANSHLWKPSDVMVGATLIYSLQGIDDMSLRKLRETATRLAALKSSPPAANKHERLYQKMLIDELDCAFGMPVPVTLSDGFLATNTVTFVPRTHMEGQMLGMTHFPILVHPDKLTAVIVPSVFWGECFKAEWREGVRPPTDSERKEELAPRGALARFRIGLGSALHPKNLFWLVLGIVIIVFSIDSFLYAIHRTPTVVKTFDELRETPSDTYVEVQARLQPRNKLETRHSKKDHWLIPFLDTGDSLFLVRTQSAHDDSKYDPDSPHIETVRGRLVRDSDGFEWRAGFRNYSVIGKYRSRGVSVPKNYLLIDESLQPSSLRAFLYGGLILLMLIFPGGFIIRVYRAYRLLRHDDRELLGMLWWQRKCLAEGDPMDYDI